MHTHRYNISAAWTGNIGQGTSSYKAYERNYTFEAPKIGAPYQILQCSTGRKGV